ncbi:MAG: SIR2 family NAD-dependent protein deacylase [Hyphomicrobiales bacterium]
MVQRARRAVAFTGAGISTECGIPDFRSPGGFWTQHKPIEFGEFMRSETKRLEAWRRLLAIRDRFGGAAPGRGHAAVAHLVARGHVSSVITQNIDGLHHSSGIPAERIIEIHGNGTYARCLVCERRHELDWARAAIAATAVAPRCQACGGIVKPATISFGQPMPELAMAEARAATLDADLFLAIGSSLQVFPAAGLPVMAAHNRTPLVIVNREPTGLDGLATLVINGEIGEVLSAVAEIAAETESAGHEYQKSRGRSPA